MAFTGNKDVDRTILLGLNDADLSNICQTNTYFKSLCSEDLFWRTKILQRFGKYLGNVSQIEKYMSKYKLKTWKSYYISLVDFLERKYLGYFVPSVKGTRRIIRKFEDFRQTTLKREDIKKLNDIIDKNDAMLIENIKNFIKTRDNQVDTEEFKIFMDQQLDNDMLNPSSIFTVLPTTASYENKFGRIMEVLVYFLNSKDRRIHPEYFDNDLLKKLADYEDPYDEEGKLYRIVLNDNRVDPNSVLGEIASNNGIPDDFIHLVLQDPRIEFNKIRETIKEYIEDPDTVSVDGLLKIFEAFLEKEGTLGELKYMVENIENRDDNVTVHFEEFIMEHQNSLKQQIIYKLSSNKYSDDVYYQILALL